jgi:hypothetical protein
MVVVQDLEGESPLKTRLFMWLSLSIKYSPEGFIVERLARSKHICSVQEPQ